MDHVFGNVAFPKLLALGGLQQCIARGVTEGRLGWVDGATVAGNALQVANLRDIRLGRATDVGDITFAAGSWVTSPEYASELINCLRPPPPAAIAVPAGDTAAAGVAPPSAASQQAPTLSVDLPSPQGPMPIG